MPRKKVTAQAAAAPAVPVAPLAPSPAVLDLQAKVSSLVDQREQAMDAVTAAQAELHIAQAKVQTATAKVQQIDQMVQYRMGIIAQMEGRPQQTQMSQVVSFPTGVISSEPGIQPNGAFQGYNDNDMVNRAHASRELAGDIRRAL